MLLVFKILVKRPDTFFSLLQELLWRHILTLWCPGFIGKHYSIKCLNSFLSSDENGLSSYLDCLKTCDDKDQDGDEDGDKDGDKDDNVTDDNVNIDGDESIEDGNNDNVDSEYGMWFITQALKNSKSMLILILSSCKHYLA